MKTRYTASKITTKENQSNANKISGDTSFGINVYSLLELGFKARRKRIKCRFCRREGRRKISYLWFFNEPLIKKVEMILGMVLMCLIL
ncbi:MAG: hypothetical protein PWQ74_1155 [Methanobacteriaceae archaeon]|nr:hypothetical protein [Methanobacteriaceae archaeon]